MGLTERIEVYLSKEDAALLKRAADLMTLPENDIALVGKSFQSDIVLQRFHSNITMGLTERIEVLLSKEDVALLKRVAKLRHSTQPSIVREALMEWLARRGFLSKEETAALGFSPQTISETSAPRLEPRSSDSPSKTKWSP
jgi:uncharacterized protein (DUF1778 family)